MDVGGQRTLTAFDVMEKTARAVSDFENFELMTPGKQYEISFKMRNCTDGKLEVADFLVKEVPSEGEERRDAGPGDIIPVWVDDRSKIS